MCRCTVSSASRASSARATAVFSDISKIGGGYADCRDAYATCMDQFCASANDTYRRCYCSDRFIDFRDTTNALDTASTMLADFQNTNLDAVDKTAAEVNAMYTASEGEAAIKRDTSASQKLLDSITDILSGKKSSYKKSSYAKNSGSNGVLDVSGLFSFSGSDEERNREREKLLSAFTAWLGSVKPGKGYGRRVFRVVSSEGESVITAESCPCKLPVSALQKFLDEYASGHPVFTLDYIHGEDTLRRLSALPGCLGFIFDGMEKKDLFPAVEADGSLPRKTFSMGSANDKRYYTECRRIV